MSHVKEVSKMKRLLLVVLLLMLVTGCSSLVTPTRTTGDLDVAYRWGDGYKVGLYSENSHFDVPIYTEYICDGVCEFKDINPGTYEVRVYDDYDFIDSRTVMVKAGGTTTIVFGI
jgi:hypothetical protein